MSAKSEICISYFRFQTLFLTSSPPTGNTDLKTLNVINAFKLPFTLHVDMWMHWTVMNTHYYK